MPTSSSLTTQRSNNSFLHSGFYISNNCNTNNKSPFTGTIVIRNSTPHSTLICRNLTWNGCRWRQYGLWERYTDLYPTEDLVYTVGQSDWRKDWFFAHLTRYANPSKYLSYTCSYSFCETLWLFRTWSITPNSVRLKQRYLCESSSQILSEGEAYRMCVISYVRLIAEWILTAHTHPQLGRFVLSFPM